VTFEEDRVFAGAKKLLPFGLRIHVAADQRERRANKSIVFVFRGRNATVKAKKIIETDDKVISGSTFTVSLGNSAKMSWP